MSILARIIALAALLVVGASFADALQIPEAVYPELPKSAPTAGGFVPQGWTIEVQADGDLNQDGIPDLLLVLRQDSPANVVANDADGLGLQEINTNPRILAVAFARREGGYVLSLENHDFIPRYDTPTIDDPFGFAEIADGRFRIGLHYWANAGSWYTDDTTFVFLYRDNAFRLVGYQDYTTKRNTGETWETSLDYFALTAKITLGSFSDDTVENRTYEKPLPGSPLQTIAELGGGWDRRPEQTDLAWWGLENQEE